MFVPYKDKIYGRDWARAYVRKYPERSILNAARRRAKVNKLDFNLELEDIIIPEICPVLNIPLAFSRTGEKTPRSNSPSLDRVDNTKGYIKGNVAIISNRANQLKDNATIQELESIVNYMKSYANSN